MTVLSSVSREQYATSGIAGPWTVPFYFLEDSDLTVVYTNSAGADTELVLDADYTVAGAGSPSGGTVTTMVAYAAGGLLTILRDVDYTQQTVFVDGDPQPAASMNAALDKLTMLAQQTRDIADRCIQFPNSYEGPTDVADVATRRGKLLGFTNDVFAELTYAGPISGSTSDLAVELASATGAAEVGFIEAFAGAVLQTVLDRLRSVAVSDASFGAVGDDTADDTGSLKNAIAAAAGRTLRLRPGKTYKIASDELLLSVSTHIDGNGAQLHFTHTNTGKRCLAVVTGCVVENLFVNNTSGVLGTNGTYQTPVVIGDAASTTVNSNIKLRNLTIASLTPGGNGIAIIGATNVDVEGITYPSSSTIAIPLLCHWSSASGGPSATSHVHNVRIDNIKCGVMSYGTSGALGIAAVFLSAVYGVKVSNIYADQFTHGAAVTVYAGDYGYQYGTTVEQAMGMVGIDITGITGQYLMVGHVYGTNPSGAVQQLWPGGVTFEKLGAYGMGADTSSQGIRLEGCEGVQVKCSAVNAFQVGVYLGGTVTDVTIEDVRILNSRTHGIFGDTTSGTPNFSEIVIRDARIVGSNQSSASNIADISFGACAGLLIEECKFNSPNANWNVVVANTVTVMRVLNNRTLGVGAGPCYAIGANTDTAICSLFEGNTCDAAAIPAGGLRAGQIFIPHAALMRNASGEQPKVFTGSFSPDRGTWARGSICWNDQASVGQPKGWACTVTGTPGTWVSMGNL